MSQKPNIYKMKQPELGKTIAHLRQSRGLTQEELVEKCNISIRTIQRIESGEVTPRSFTIRALFSALDYSYQEEDFDKNENKVDSLVFRLYLSVIAGIVYFIIGFPEGYLDLQRFEDLSPDITPIFYAIVKALSAVSLILFLRGFWVIGSTYRLTLLKVGSLVLMVIMVLNNLIDISTLIRTTWDTEEVFMIQMIMLSIGIVFFGSALIMSRNKVGDLSLVAGITEIFIAATLITIILGFISLILSVFATIFEIIILYQVAKKISAEQKAEKFYL